MTKEETEGNKLIAEFMGLPKVDGYQNVYRINDGKPNWYSAEPKYHFSWDWLMEACKKFDNIYKDYEWSKIVYSEYMLRCEDIDNAVTLFEKKDAFKALVKGIKWFNKNKQKGINP